VHPTRQQGLLVRPRYAAGRTDVVTGYAVALRPTPGVRPIWYGGTSLGIPIGRGRGAAGTAGRDAGDGAGCVDAGGALHRGRPGGLVLPRRTGPRAAQLPRPPSDKSRDVLPSARGASLLLPPFAVTGPRTRCCSGNSPPPPSRWPRSIEAVLDGRHPHRQRNLLMSVLNDALGGQCVGDANEAAD
jgi:hypothetical protein